MAPSFYKWLLTGIIALWHPFYVSVTEINHNAKQQTLEISCKIPVRIYKGMPIGQLIYFPVEGEVDVKYNTKKDAKYSGQPDRPVESMMWKNKF